MVSPREAKYNVPTSWVRPIQTHASKGLNHKKIYTAMAEEEKQLKDLVVFDPFLAAGKTYQPPHPNAGQAISLEDLKKDPDPNRQANAKLVEQRLKQHFSILTNNLNSRNADLKNKLYGIINPVKPQELRTGAETEGARIKELGEEHLRLIDNDDHIDVGMAINAAMHDQDLINALRDLGFDNDDNKIREFLRVEYAKKFQEKLEKEKDQTYKKTQALYDELTKEYQETPKKIQQEANIEYLFNYFKLNKKINIPAGTLSLADKNKLMEQKQKILAKFLEDRPDLNFTKAGSWFSTYYIKVPTESRKEFTFSLDANPKLLLELWRYYNPDKAEKGPITFKGPYNSDKKSEDKDWKPSKDAIKKMRALVRLAREQGLEVQWDKEAEYLTEDQITDDRNLVNKTRRTLEMHAETQRTAATTHKTQEVDIFKELDSWDIKLKAQQQELSYLISQYESAKQEIARHGASPQRDAKLNNLVLAISAQQNIILTTMNEEQASLNQLHANPNFSYDNLPNTYDDKNEFNEKHAEYLKTQEECLDLIHPILNDAAFEQALGAVAPGAGNPNVRLHKDLVTGFATQKTGLDDEKAKLKGHKNDVYQMSRPGRRGLSAA